LYAVTDEGVLRAAVEHIEQRMKSTTLPALKSPAAYLRDALKKKYSGAGEGSGPSENAEEAKAPKLTLNEKLRHLREEWHLYKAAEAKGLFAEMPDAGQTGYLAKFEVERLSELATPIAKAWRKDGINSRIAASSFYRWLALQLWPAEVTDKDLLEFAVTRDS
jgi:hypothetical protein